MKRILRSIIVLPIAILLLAAGAVYFLGCTLAPNDLCFFFDPGRQRFNESEARIVKPAVMALRQPKTVILGGSRALDQLSPRRHAKYAPGYNFSTVAITPYELNAYAKYATEVAKPAQMIISLSYIIFLMEEKHRQGFRLEEKTVRGFPNPRFYTNILESLLHFVRIDRGYPRLVNSGYKLFDSEGGKVITPELGSCKHNDTVWHKDNLSLYVDYYGAFLRNEKKDEIYRANMTQLSVMLERLAAQAGDVEVILVVLPLHDSLAATRAMTGITEHYLAWLDEVAALAEDTEISRFLVFDNLPSLTDETFTYRADCDGYDLANWYNPSHAFPSIGHQLEINDIPGTRFRWKAQNMINERELLQYKNVTRHRYGEMAEACFGLDDVLNNCFIATKNAN